MTVPNINWFAYTLSQGRKENGGKNIGIAKSKTLSSIHIIFVLIRRSWIQKHYVFQQRSPVPGFCKHLHEANLHGERYK